MKIQGWSLIAVLASVFGLTGCITKSGTADTTDTTSTLNNPGSTRALVLQGCLNQVLYNGVLEFKVKGVERIFNSINRPGWGVNIDITNVTKTDVKRISDTGINGLVEGTQITLANGYSLDIHLGSDELEYISNFSGKQLFHGQTLPYQFKFYDTQAGTSKATIFQLKIDSTRIQSYIGVKYSVLEPGFKVDLTKTRDASGNCV
jgi:hypothetical protein